jgi:hypothetical protein
VSDGNQAMLNAITKQFPASARKPCVVHKMDNVLSYVPNKQQEQLKAELKALFSQKDRQAADQAVAAFIEKYQKVYPTAIECHEPRSRGLSDLLRLPEGTLEDDSHQQCDRAALRRGQAPLSQNGNGFSHRRELFIAVLCSHPQFALQHTQDACSNKQATRRRDFTQLLTYYQ